MKRQKVKRAKKGDNQAFQELMDEEKARLYKMAYIYVKNENDALDIFQETVYKAYTSIKNLKEEEFFSTWITRILINTAIDYIRKNKRITPMDKDMLENKTIVGHSRIEDKMDLLSAIGELEEKYKTVLILRFYKDYTVKQIASILEWPEGTVKTTIHRAVNKLRGKLGEVCINE